MIWAVISWIIIGAIIGGLARLIMPGKQDMGLVATILLGVVGAIVGGFIVGLLGGDGGIKGIMQNPWSFGTIALAVVGALILIFIFGFITKKKA
ncbi:GlsB/YeaQ/YmgE family stress response membrane protein [Propioniferax innocua]|uniref:Putative membrane protein YeaQ/YmgE (Transglycosylase-associated protein family) n=1 Tax=Propioniferax innocua TaxID=1753 RepID=A0A542ZS30_9ACTN|nr:GlsB/YeaQ/YmgE family stress response membrane protein [Propioniferax innocua]TQL63164.1 putative membrane protein YeaQ/YmgE (transglycosylase-associated protein family) [Propioniferax innocua]